MSYGDADRYRAVLWTLAVAVEDHLATNHGNRHTPMAGPAMGESIRLLRRANKLAREALGEKKFMGLRARSASLSTSNEAPEGQNERP